METPIDSILAKGRILDKLVFIAAGIVLFAGFYISVNTGIHFSEALVFVGSMVGFALVVGFLHYSGAESAFVTWPILGAALVSILWFTLVEPYCDARFIRHETGSSITIASILELNPEPENQELRWLGGGGRAPWQPDDWPHDWWFHLIGLALIGITGFGIAKLQDRY